MRYVSLFIAALALPACAVERHQLRPAALAAPRTFALTVQTAPRELPDDAPRAASALVAPAHAARLRGPRRAVIIAPADCQRGATHSALASPEQPAPTCEVLIGALEAALTRAGYKLIPWRALQAVEAPTRLDAARQLQAEVAFELGAITPSPLAQRTTLSFAQVDHDGGLTPVRVHSRVGHRCAAMLQREPIAHPSALPTTLALSAIDVERGQPVWLYRQQLGDKAQPAAQTLYFTERGARHDADSEAARLMAERAEQLDALYDEEERVRAAGGALLFSGGLLSGVGGVTLAAAQGDSPSVAGALMLGAGIATLLADAAIFYPRVGHAQQRADRLAHAWNADTRRALDPEDVICLTPPVAAPGADASPAAASYTFDPAALPGVAPVDVRQVVLDAAAATLVEALTRDIAPR